MIVTPATCPHCEEEILPADKSIDNSAGGSDHLRFHAECFTRMIVGSAKHQLRKCSCYGFTEEEEPGLTKRRWARRATAMFQLLNNLDWRAKEILKEASAEVETAAEDTAHRA